MKVYKVLKGYYGGVEEETLILPSELKLLYRDGDMFSCLTDGHNNFLGCLKKSDSDVDMESKLDELNNGGIDFYDCDDLLFIVIDNIKFVSESPGFYTPEEFMSEFEIDKYFIETKELGYFKNIESRENLSEEDWVDGETCDICKIIKVLGPYSVEVSRVINYSNTYKTNIYDMSVQSVTIHNLLFNKIPSSKVTILTYKNDDSKYKEMIRRVLDQFGYTN